MIDRLSLIKISVIILIEILLISLFFINLSFSLANNYEHAIQQKSINRPANLFDVESSGNFLYTLSGNTTINQSAGNLTLNLTKFDSELNQVWITSFNTSFSFGNINNNDILAATNQTVLIGVSYYYQFKPQYLYLIVGKNGIETTFNMTLQAQNGHLLTPLAMGLDYLIFYEIINSQAPSTPYLLSGIKLSPNGDNASLFSQPINTQTNVKPFYRDRNTIEIPIYSTSFKNYYPNNTNPRSYPIISNLDQLHYDIHTNTIKMNSLNIYETYNQIKNTYYIENRYNLYNLSLYIFPYKNGYSVIEFDNYKDKTIIYISSGSKTLAKYSINKIIHPAHKILNFEPTYDILIPFYQIGDKYYFNIDVYDNQSNQQNTELLMYNPLHSVISLNQFPYQNTQGDVLQFTYTVKLGNNVAYIGSVSTNSSSISVYYFVKIYRLKNNPLDLIVFIPLPFKFIIGAILVIPTVFYLIKRKTTKPKNSELFPVKNGI